MITSYYIDFHPDVESDYNDAYHWYELQRKDLGERFLLQVHKKLEKIKLSPETYGAKSRKDYREAKVDDFPYLVVYRVYPKKKKIFVSAIHHEKMDPHKKYRR